MNGGVVGTRGYLAQTLVCLCEALDADDWVSVMLEPDDLNEKVDIEWVYPNGCVFQQVKSREASHFTRSEAEKILQELCSKSPSAGKTVLRSEVILVGDWHESLLADPRANPATAGAHRFVRPSGTTTAQLYEVAGYRILKFADRHGLGALTSTQCERMVFGSSGFLLSSVITRRRIQRFEFTDIMTQWTRSILEIGSSLDAAYVREANEFQQRFGFAIESRTTRNLFRKFQENALFLKPKDLKESHAWIDPSAEGTSLVLTVPKGERAMKIYWQTVILLVFGLGLTFVVFSSPPAGKQNLGGFLAGVFLMFVAATLVLCSNISKLGAAKRVAIEVKRQYHPPASSGCLR